MHSISSLKLDLPPSCVEFCTEFPGTFVVGTYYLQSKDEGGGEGSALAQTRNGSLLVFRLTQDGNL